MTRGPVIVLAPRGLRDVAAPIRASVDKDDLTVRLYSAGLGEVVAVKCESSKLALLLAIGINAPPGQ